MTASSRKPATGSRRRLLVAAAIVAAVVGIGAYAFRNFVGQFPHHRLFSRSGYADAARMLTGRDIPLSDFDPGPGPQLPRASIARARYPVIDLHFHLVSLENVSPDRLVAAMDSVGIETIVNLDGQPNNLEKLMAQFRDRYPERFMTFAVPGISKIGRPGFEEGQLAALDRAARAWRSGSQGMEGARPDAARSREATGPGR